MAHSMVTTKPPALMEVFDWPEEVWVVKYADGTYFCMWNCVAVCSTREAIDALLEALETDEPCYRDGERVKVVFDAVRDEAVRRGCDGLILVDVPEEPRRWFVR